MKQMVSKTR